MVLDASAILALLYKERGYPIVRSALAAGSIVCSVNLAEVATKLLGRGDSIEHLESIIHNLPLAVHAADLDLAFGAARLAPVTKGLGLSLGDRFCLALAARESLPALTADRIWGEAGRLLGIDVRLIR